MRNLTIKRTKALVGSFFKVKIYIEDPVTGDLIINDTPCRQIGELKNGEEKTFLIEEQALRVYVIVDKLSKDYCNDYYQLPEGTQDVFLSGRNRFNLANGNAFRFDNNESEEVLAHHQRSARKGRSVMLIAAVAGGIVGFLVTSGVLFGVLFGSAPKEKAFSFGGMNITLSEAFRETDVEGFDVVYDSKNVGVFVTKDSFTLMDGLEEYSLQQYADLVIEFSDIQAVKKEGEDGLFRFEYDYTTSDTGDLYRDFAYVYKTDDAFWLVEFVVFRQEADRYLPDIAAWAKSVTFSDG
ncbi:MAG: hypothetical protein IKI50_04555 [Clostridia bacterium]|nr:hypothetical protein [Clostridia bacterium]